MRYMLYNDIYQFWSYFMSHYKTTLEIHSDNAYGAINQLASEHSVVDFAKITPFLMATSSLVTCKPMKRSITTSQSA